LLDETIEMSGLYRLQCITTKIKIQKKNSLCIVYSIVYVL